MDEVIEFPKVKVLSEAEALDYLRREGPIEGVSRFAKLAGWERTRAQRMLARWQRDGAVVLKPGGPGGRTAISAPRVAVDDLAAARAPAQMTVRCGAQPSAPDAHPAHRVAHPRSHLLGSISAVPTPASILASVMALVFVALALGGTGIIMNARYAASLGSSDEGATVLAVVGVAVDLLAMIFPSVALALWRRGHRSLAMVPWTMWPVMVVLSLMATAGFASSNLADVFAQRSRAAFTAAGIEDTVRRLRNERAGIAEKRSAAELEIQVQRDRPKVDRIDRDAWNDTKGCTRLTTDGVRACAPILPTLQALSVAQHRDVVDAQLRAAEASLASASTVVAVDPQAEILAEIVAWITAGLMKPSSADIARLRVLGLVAMPSLAGLVLSLAFAVAAPRAVSNSSETIGRDPAIN
jgi:hypothetical protein